MMQQMGKGKMPPGMPDMMGGNLPPGNQASYGKKKKKKKGFGEL